LHCLSVVYQPGALSIDLFHAAVVQFDKALVPARHLFEVIDDFLRA